MPGAISAPPSPAYCMHGGWRAPSLSRVAEGGAGGSWQHFALGLHCQGFCKHLAALAALQMVTHGPRRADSLTVPILTHPSLVRGVTGDTKGAPAQFSEPPGGGKGRDGFRPSGRSAGSSHFTDLS